MTGCSNPQIADLLEAEDTALTELAIAWLDGASTDITNRAMRAWHRAHACLTQMRVLDLADTIAAARPTLVQLAPSETYRAQLAELSQYLEERDRCLAFLDGADTTAGPPITGAHELATLHRESRSDG